LIVIFLAEGCYPSFLLLEQELVSSQSLVPKFLVSSSIGMPIDHLPAPMFADLAPAAPWWQSKLYAGLKVRLVSNGGALLVPS